MNKRKAFIQEMEDNINSIYDGLTIDNIVHIETADESFMAIQIPSREITGCKGFKRIIRLDGGLEITLINPEKITKLNGKPFSYKLEWKVKDYIIRLAGDTYTCTCKGYMFRKKCKHIDEVKMRNGE
jgi:hypothetical protein